MFNIVEKISIGLIVALFVMAFVFGDKSYLGVALGIAVTNLINVLSE